jgi:tRNA (cmo5U34)-methyltransferase
MKRVYEGMTPNSALILIEKLTVGDSLINRLFIRHYYDLKRRRHYSEMEIAQKREALENVLIPYRYEENRDLLRNAGFRHVETFFRWYNFGGMLAVK